MNAWAAFLVGCAAGPALFAGLLLLGNFLFDAFHASRAPRIPPFLRKDAANDD